MCLLLIVVLALSANFSENYETEYGQIDQRKILVTGTVSDIVYKSSKNGLTETVYIDEAVTSEGLWAQGVVCFLKDCSKEPRIGATVTMEGKAALFEKATNPGQFDKREFYEITGVCYQIKGAEIVYESPEYNAFLNMLYIIRRDMSSKLDEALPENEASIMKTMLLGEKSEIDTELKALYQRNGIAHVLSISGLHISLIGMGVFRILKAICKKMKAAAFLSIPIVIFYSAMTGFSVSSIRAVIMFSLSMIAVLIGRTYDSLTALSLSGAVILVSEPLYVFHSGFIFSFGCILGINLLMPSLSGKDKSLCIKTPNKLITTVLSSLTMLVIGFPIYLYFYYQIPVYSFLLNILVIPVMSILVPMGFFLIMMMYIFVPGAVPFRIGIVGILSFFEKAAESADSLPGHFYTPGCPELWQIGVYIVFVILAAGFRGKRKLWKRWIVCFMAMLFLCLRTYDGFCIDVLDVGQGESICIRECNVPVSLPGITSEHSFLIDGGSTSVSGVGQYRILPYLKYEGISNLDGIFVTHADSDHYNGILELVEIGREEGITIKRLFLPKIGEDMINEGYLKLVDAADKEKIDVVYITRGDVITAGDLKLKVLWPSEDFSSEDINEGSLTLLAEYGEFNALLTGDLEGEGEKSVAQNAGNIDVLKCAHHGSEGATFEDFLEVTEPKITMISCGLNNSYGHPSKRTLERLENVGSAVLRTDLQGCIMLDTDGSELHLSTFK